METLKLKLTIFGTILLTWGCTSGDPDPIITPGPENEIQGEWLWPCYDISVQNQTASYELDEIYDGGTYTGTYYVYASSDCTGTTYQATNTATGTYTLGADFESDNVPSLIATEIDLDLTTVATSGDSTFLNLVDSHIIWGLGGQFYDIFYVDQSRLYWSDFNTGGGTTPATRATEINLLDYAILL